MLAKKKRKKRKERFSIKYLTAKLEYLSWYFFLHFFSFELKFHYLLYLELSTHQDSNSRGQTAAKLRKLDALGASLFNPNVQHEFEKKKKKKPECKRWGG